MRLALRAIALFGFAVTSACGSDSSPARASAETLFASYQSLEQAYDPAVADLYCETALIRNTRHYPDGQARVIEIPAPQYKGLIRTAMPLAQARGDYSTYSDVEYAAEGANMRITATRFSVLKNYASPISLLVGPCSGEAWAILEEISESQP